MTYFYSIPCSICSLRHSLTLWSLFSTLRVPKKYSLRMYLRRTFSCPCMHACMHSPLKIDDSSYDKSPIEQELQNSGGLIPTNVRTHCIAMPQNNSQLCLRKAPECRSVGRCDDLATKSARNMMMLDVRTYLFWFMQ